VDFLKNNGIKEITKVCKSYPFFYNIPGFILRIQILYNDPMQTITWNLQCYVCHRPMFSGKPALIFSTTEANLVGIAHSSCSITKIGPGCFQTCPPFYLSSGQVSFLAQLFPMVFSLPGGLEPNGMLRNCLASLLYPYPESMINPLATLQQERDLHRSLPWTYEGDLEGDFLRSLGQVQRLAKENPIDIEVDFRKVRL
jgi:hypothetical protein